MHCGLASISGRMCGSVAPPCAGLCDALDSRLEGCGARAECLEFLKLPACALDRFECMACITCLFMGSLVGLGCAFKKLNI